MTAWVYEWRSLAYVAKSQRRPKIVIHRLKSNEVESVIKIVSSKIFWIFWRERGAGGRERRGGGRHAHVCGCSLVLLRSVWECHVICVFLMPSNGWPASLHFSFFEVAEFARSTWYELNRNWELPQCLPHRFYQVLGRRKRRVIHCA